VDCWKHEKAARADERSKLSDSLELAKLQRDEVRDERDLLQRKYDRVVVGGNEALDRVTAERDAAQFALTNATAAHDAVSLRAANGDLAESIRRREAGIRLNSKLILGLTARKETLEADLARVTAERDGAKSALREIAYVVCGSEFYVDVNDAVEAMAKELYEAAGWVTSWGDCWNSTTVEAWRKAAKRAIELGAKTTAVKS
jgi:hypothetical protein